MIKISYICATYDTADWLDKHLEHMLHQNDPNFEVIVVNHESPSYDKDVALKWCDKDSRIRLIDMEDHGCYGPAWVKGWEEAKGKYVCNSNVDDFHDASFTSIFYDSMESASEKIGFCYSGLNIIDINGKLLGRSLKPTFDYDRYSYQCESGPQVCWRNDTKFRETIDWDLVWRRSKQYVSAFDYWLFLYFMSLGYYGFVIQSILTTYTQRKDSVEHKNYGTVSTYESLLAISEFFSHNFKNRLKEFKEFSNFPIVPNREEWIEFRKRGKKWAGNNWININD
jgi:glycosyltransferase involved in cell wall biosynthesis